MESYRADLFNDSLSNSLKTIRAAKSRFHFLTGRDSTQAALASQIELCDVLLEEIQSISSSLEERMTGCSAINRRPVITRRARSSRHMVMPLRDPLNRSKRKKLALRPGERKPEAGKRDKEDVS